MLGEKCDFCTQNRREHKNKLIHFHVGRTLPEMRSKLFASSAHGALPFPASLQSLSYTGYYFPSATRLTLPFYTRSHQSALSFTRCLPGLSLLPYAIGPSKRSCSLSRQGRCYAPFKRKERCNVPVSRFPG